jgi:hypothetical protein
MSEFKWFLRGILQIFTIVAVSIVALALWA